MTAPEAPATDLEARAAIMAMEGTLVTIIESVATIADTTREHDEAAAKAIERLGEIVGHLADRVRMLELDKERGE